MTSGFLSGLHTVYIVFGVLCLVVAYEEIMASKAGTTY